jgi:CubicO group peptidase (beta-lactamase class C family)
MRRAIDDRVFPGAVLLVCKAGDIRFHKAYGYSNIFTRHKTMAATVFDLASLTKPLATTLAIMNLIDQGRLELEQDLETVLPEFKKTEKKKIKIKHLLSHNSGLPDYRPYYIGLKHQPRDDRKRRLNEMLVNEPLLNPIGETVLYSDLGFMILGWAVERLSGRHLDRFVAEQIYKPPVISNLFFPSADTRTLDLQFAATEICFWRKRLITGVVHDDNAYVVGGIAGHAGLFGTAEGINGLLLELLSAFHHGPSRLSLKTGLVRKFLTRYDDTERALGFDCPSSTGSSCGRYFSKSSVGHLGFTGTSFWVDLERSIIVIMLTNRIHPSRENERIRAFRPQLHDAVMMDV